MAVNLQQCLSNLLQVYIIFCWNLPSLTSLDTGRKRSTNQQVTQSHSFTCAHTDIHYPFVFFNVCFKVIIQFSFADDLTEAELQFLTFALYQDTSQLKFCPSFLCCPLNPSTCHITYTSHKVSCYITFFILPVCKWYLLKKIFYFHNALINYFLQALSPLPEKRKIVYNLMIIKMKTMPVQNCLSEMSRITSKFILLPICYMHFITKHT